MRFQAGMVGVITGAGSGFGREMSLILAKKGMHLGLSDVNMKGLEETANMCREAAKSAGFPDCKFLAFKCDVGNSKEVFDFAAAVREQLAQDGRIDYVAANAGIGASATSWVDEPVETTEKVIQINLMGVLYTSKAFLPMLQAQKRGSCLLLVSSYAGIMASPGMTSYCATKFGVRGFGESLMREMKKNSPHVLVSLVHPGFASTNLFSTMPISRQVGGPVSSPDDSIQKKLADGNASRSEIIDYLYNYSSHTGKSAAEAMVKGVERGASRLLLGPEAHIWDLAVRLAPRLAYTTVGSTFVEILALVVKGIARFTPFTSPGVPSFGTDRTLLLAGSAGVATAVLRRSRL